MLGREAPQRASREETGALLALTLLGLLLRMSGLSHGLYADEAYSLALAQRGFGQMLALFGYEPNGTPYSIALWPLIRIFGSSEALMRVPAMVAGTASVPALWWAARRFVTPAAALLAAGLLAINPMAVWYGQDARAYSFVVLAACLSLGALSRALGRDGMGWMWVAYLAAMVALAYSEIFAAPLLLFAQALIARGAGRTGVRRWLRSLLAVLVCCVPLLVAATIARERRNALYWLTKPNRGIVKLALQEFTAGFSGISAVRWVTLFAGAALLAAAAVVSWHSSRTKGERPRVELGGALAVALCWGALPGILLFAIAFAEPVFWPRYAILALPGLCLLPALAAQRLWRSRRGSIASAVCLAAVVASAAVADARQRTAVEEDWRPVAAWLQKERAPGEPVIVDNASVLPALGYYYRPFRAPDGDLVVQEWHDRPLPAGFVGLRDPGGFGTVPDGPPSVSELRSLALRGDGTVWLVFSEVVPALQANPWEGVAVAWARAHCRVRLRETLEVRTVRASGCRRGRRVALRPLT
jgi:mannosyltransferase